MEGQRRESRGEKQELGFVPDTRGTLGKGTWEAVKKMEVGLSPQA